jgi:hypothetical protein
MRAYSFLSGAVALLGLAAYASSHYLGLGEGGIERVVAYPQTIYLAVIGCYLIAKSPALPIASDTRSLPHEPSQGAPGQVLAQGTSPRRETPPSAGQPGPPRHHP